MAAASQLPGVFMLVGREVAATRVERRGVRRVPTGLDKSRDLDQGHKQRLGVRKRPMPRLHRVHRALGPACLAGTRIAISLAPAPQSAHSRGFPAAPFFLHSHAIVTIDHSSPRSSSPLPLAFSTAAALALSGCSSSETSTLAPPSEPAALTFVSAGNGFAELLPHRAALPAIAGQPMGPPVTLRSVSDVTDAASLALQLLPAEPFEPSPVLPSGATGNHYFAAQFSGVIDLDTLLLYGSGAGFDPAEDLGVFSVDPTTGDYARVPARLFIAGHSLSGLGTLERWVDFDPVTGLIEEVVPGAEGFPGTMSVLAGSADLVGPGSIVCVADSDGDLSSPETFPSGVTLRLQIPAELLSTDGSTLGHRVVACSTVGPDDISPEVLGRANPYVVPAPDETGVDPAATVMIRFTEPVRFGDLGLAPFDPGRPGSLGAALSLAQGTTGFEPPIVSTVVPETAYDLTRFIVTPIRPFFGQSSAGTSAVIGMDTVRVTVAPGTLTQAGDVQTDASSRAFESRFQVGPGPSLTNAPVAPEAIYAVRSGARSGLSIVDLNGFGQSTGNPVSSSPIPLKGESRFPYNPNVLFNELSLELMPGTTTLDGGSAGAFTLTLDSNLEDVLATAPLLVDPSEIQLGVALDLVLNNAPPPFGCQAGGGYVCALTGLKVLAVGDLSVLPGFPNLISMTPHPNPPRVSFPGACLFPEILGDEPTSVDSAATGNLLVPGNPFPDPLTSTPPMGTLAHAVTAFFAGPSRGQTEAAGCQPYAIRQGLGHFGYVVDRGRSEVVVINSNRMTVMERIPLPDPTDLTVSPFLDVVAVSNAATGTVSIIDINPASLRFHEVIETIVVGAGPRGLVFDPLNEDLFVCNEGDGTISIIRAGTLAVRKTVPSLVSQPFEMVMTPRMDDFSFERGVSFGYVLGRDGQVGFYEGGPDGPLGFGYDTVVGMLPFQFLNPKAVQLDPLNLDASVYIAHEGPIDLTTGAPGALGDGAISRVRMESALFGIQLLANSDPLTPSFRDVQVSVRLSLAASSAELSGIPVDIAFDELVNRGGERSPMALGTGGSPPEHNGKGTFRRVGPGDVPTPVSQTRFLFAAIADAGVVDTLDLGTPAVALFDVDVYEDGVQSISAPGITGLSHYWRQ